MREHSSVPPNVATKAPSSSHSVRPREPPHRARLSHWLDGEASEMSAIDTARRAKEEAGRDLAAVLALGQRDSPVSEKTIDTSPPETTL